MRNEHVDCGFAEEFCLPVTQGLMDQAPPQALLVKTKGEGRILESLALTIKCLAWKWHLLSITLGQKKSCGLVHFQDDEQVQFCEKKDRCKLS